MLNNISLRILIKKFRKFGFSGPYSGSKHLFMVKEKLKVRIPNPHKGDISRFLLIEILKQAGISPNEWDQS